ncbi:secA Wing and Scaffold domain protein [Mycobacterium ulcerans str. Harvey]|uniref:SecA Wing and Scaffold domain protein n=1 Tax=Mycobacterium ulcerans str. Harvey TaxID=1299332 RepID=A0ABP3AGR5_MYCUL|nr:secA Wing and Scaffold domain protein [Mycobacterium ulcerans str. Harvey]
MLDTITVQALINRYVTVCGMTGTALAAGEQLRQFYKLGVSPIPPNTPNIREDESDRVYITAAAKNDAIVEHIAEVHDTGQPVLVGTRDVAESEDLHERLLRRDIPAVVLNAKNDAEEAAVIAEAGTLSRVTVSTQMAGRGTDIRLGGSDEADHDQVAELGGLHVVGTGRHHTQRLDNQLRGRAGRQGDPGSSVFFSSWEDDVVAANLDGNKLPMETDEDGQIVSAKAAGLLDHAQRVAEGRMLDVHANTWRYNQLIAQQRAIIVDRRNTLLRTATAREELADLAPKRYKELSETVSEDRLEKICRMIMLYHLDRAGQITWHTWPTSGKAFTCGRSVGRIRLTSFTGWRWTRLPRWPRTRSRRHSRPSKPPTFSKTSPGWICPNWPGPRRHGPTWSTTTHCPTTLSLR